MTTDERQEEELQVLEAIYGEGAVVDLRKDDAWKIPRPPEFLLTVTPNHDSKSVRIQSYHLLVYNETQGI